MVSLGFIQNGFIPVQPNRAIQLNGSPGCNNPNHFACFKFNSLTFVKFSSPYTIFDLNILILVKYLNTHLTICKNKKKIHTLQNKFFTFWLFNMYSNF
jgi:hypothetical protein